MTSLGTTIRGYEVWGRVGEGGMSEVWLAKHSALLVPVIIKTLRTAFRTSIDDETAASRVLAEARLMARVTDSRVVRAVDAGVTEEGVAYLIQEYVDGLDLAELDRRRRAALGVGLPLWFVCYAMREICAGLHSAHQAGVIHRDVKPSNIFGAAETGIRLGDFGIAVAHADRPSREVSGTIKFMAPEQLRGERVGRYTDVYGAGATACDLRYGQPPFDTVDEVLDPNATPRLPPARSPAEAYFQHVLLGMLAKDPALRFDNAAEPGRHFATLARALPPTVAASTELGKNALRLGDCVVSLEVGDLAKAEVDAIVSSANYAMKMRAGAALSLRLRGGDEIEEEAMKDGERALGSCVATGAGKLAAKHVFHAVSAWNEVSCVGRAVARALLVADEMGCRTLAMPALGTGAGRVSIEMCANAMMSTLKWYAALGGMRLTSVRLYFETEAKLRTFRDVADEALRDHDTTSQARDLGLAAADHQVRADAATFLAPTAGKGARR